LTVTQGRRSATLPVCFAPDGDGTIGDGVVF
jgi:hypothetical protein